jgi:hypothetical protein
MKQEESQQGRESGPFRQCEKRGIGGHHVPAFLLPPPRSTSTIWSTNLAARAS